MSIDISLLPRADLPVIWDAFKAQAEAIRTTAETLTVTSITQKEEMALARKTRLTLREIRIAVEHKRVELGEGHLKEIQKVNGAARALREFIEPLEARLLIQESFAEKAEADRVLELTRCRSAELFALSPHVIVKDIGSMSQENYNSLMDTLKAKEVEKEAANRLRVEAEKRLEEAKAEAIREATAARAEAEIRLAAERAERERLRIVAESKALAIQQVLESERRREQEEQKRLNDEAEKVRVEQEAKHRAELAAALAIRTLEREAAEKLRQEERIKWAQEVAETEAKQRELKRIQEEQLTALATELAKERAAKQAEADAARKLALAPDVEKLQGYIQALLSVPLPCLKDSVACFVLQNVVDIVNKAAYQVTSFQNNLTTK